MANFRIIETHTYDIEADSFTEAAAAYMLRKNEDNLTDVEAENVVQFFDEDGNLLCSDYVD